MLYLCIVKYNKWDIMDNKIKEVLEVKALTQKELANLTGMSEMGISKAIKGSATRQTLEKIAKALDVPVSELYPENHIVERKALYEGELHLGEKTLSCAVLSDGTRVISATTVFEAFDRPRKGKSNEGYRVDRMPSFINANNLQPYVDQQLMEWTRLIEYTDLHNVKRQGYNARIIRGLCKVYMDARRDNALLATQARFAAISEAILYTLSDVGIVALVDEATGYDKVKNRAKDELQRFFKDALRENAGQWVKTFDDRFFEMIYRMRGWNWTGVSRHPGVVGIWINDIVYERLAPALLNELRRLNPKNENGGRSHKHHQFLTEEVGHPRLKEHLEGVMAIGRLSGNDWNKFMRNLDVAYPKCYQQLELAFDDETD